MYNGPLRKRQDSPTPTGPRSDVGGLTRPAELAWACVLIGAPVGVGLAVNAVNAVVGWWPGLAGLLVTAVLVGTAAYRAGRRPRR